MMRGHELHLYKIRPKCTLYAIPVLHISKYDFEIFVPMTMSRYLGKEIL